MEIIYYLQQFRTPEMDRIILAISALAGTAAWLIILSLVYWLWDRRRGWILALVFMLFMQGNTLVKEMTVQPRPYQADIRIGLVGPPPLSHGFPSGHAQAAALMFGGMALLHPALVPSLLLVGVAISVGLTRLYLGVHDLSDVLAGWAFGGLGVVMMALFFRLQDQNADFLRGWDVRIFWVILGLVLFFWAPSGGNLMACTGLSAAALLEGVERRYIGFSDPRGDFGRLARALIGLMPYLLMIPFLGYLAPEPALWLRVQFVLAAALWMFLGAPFLFKSFRI